LFDLPDAKKIRTLNVDGIESYVTERLRTIFAFVEQPVRIYSAGTRSPLFSLFFAMSNDSPAAIALARKFTRYILKNR
jgi:hypothetical protein